MRAGRLKDRTAFVVFFLVWGLLILTVQPWSRPDPTGGADSSSTVKGAILLLCIVALLMVLPPRSALRVPAPLALYLLYGVYVVSSSAFQPDALEPMVRGSRLLFGLLVPVLLWSVVRGRFHVVAYANIAAHALLTLSVLAGVVLAPSLAWQDAPPFRAQRLVGFFLPMLAPRVGEIGAVLVGLAFLMWAQRRLGPIWLIAAGAAGTALIVFSQTRTAALALILGLLVAFGATLTSPAGRRGLGLIAGSLALSLPFLPHVIEWALRYQDSEQIQKLSGRTTVWDFIISQPYDARLFWFGHGIGNKKVVLRRGEGDINTMAIDNSWLDSFWETGMVGAVLVAAAVLAAAVYALRTPGLEARALSGFLMTYVLVASVNESGLCDFSSMTLLVLAAVLISAVDRADKRGADGIRQSPHQNFDLRPSPGQPGTI
jgi:O-antigen ligase